MDWLTVILYAIGGLGMFIYGMKLMSESLQNFAGDRLKYVLSLVVRNRFAGLATGALTTAIIQSSSATTVMLVSFVNAKLLTFIQALSVALGAHIGTTLTGQLLAFNITIAALPAIALGCGLRVFATKRRTREIGGILLGFGFLFFGMSIIKDATAPFNDSEAIVRFFTMFEASNFFGILLCVAVGAIFTMVLQSSTVTVGLTMALASQGLLGLPGAAALILGDNIGTTITAEIAAIGTDISARRMARANFLSNVFGAIYMALLFPLYLIAINWLTADVLGVGSAELTLENGSKPNIARYVANAHTIYNVINSIVWITALPLLAKVAVKLTGKGKKGVVADILEPQYLDTSFLKTPLLALSQSRKEIVRMANLSNEMAQGVFQGFINTKINQMGPYQVQEEALDNLQKIIHQYLINIYSQDNLPGIQNTVRVQINLVNTIERIGDTINGIADLTVNSIENSSVLSGAALGDFKKMVDVCLEFHGLLVSSMHENRIGMLEDAYKYDKIINNLYIELRENHLERLKASSCSVEQGLIFTDMLTFFKSYNGYLVRLVEIWVKGSIIDL